MARGLQKTLLVLCAVALVAMVSCARRSDQTGAASGSVRGNISGLDLPAKVRVAALSSTGAESQTLCEVTSSSSGDFQCEVDPSELDSIDALGLTATDAGGSELRSLLVDVPTDGSSVSVSWLSELASARAMALAGKQVGIASAIDTADQEVRAAAGLKGTASIFLIDSSDPAEVATRSAFETGLRDGASSLDGIVALKKLGADFAADRSIDDPIYASLWTSIGGRIAALGEPAAYSVTTSLSPAAVPIDFEITGPVIAITAPFTITWSSALAPSYRVVLCQLPLSADTCRTVENITDTSLAVSADEAPTGDYFLWVKTSDGRDASNAAAGSPYSFRVVSP